MYVTQLLVCSSVAVGARVHEKDVRSTVGEVDFLFTTGAPALAKPYLKNAKSEDGCFKGKRTWTRKTFPVFGDRVDQVPMIPYFLGYRHPLYDAMELDLTNKVANFYPCSVLLNKEPSDRGRVLLHGPDNYIDGSSEAAPEYYDMAVISTGIGMQKEFNKGKEFADEIGWGIVSMAFDLGGLRGGPQASYLLQDPNTLECAVTFQGTDSFQDWLSNLDSESVEFCGLQDTTVHKGFRDHLMQMVTNEEWQTTVLPNLGKCSKVSAAGTSLGGAMATLFAACVNSAPEAGSAGYDEYKYVKWARGTPARLPVK